MTFLRLLLLLGLAAGPAFGLTLSLRPEAKVAGANVTVGDVVEADPALPAALLAVPLGLAPNLNESKAYSRAAVAAALANRTDLGTPTVEGSEQCVVLKPARTVAPEDLAAVLLPELQRATQGQGKVQLVEFAPALPVLVPAGEIAAQATLDPAALFHPWANAAVNYYVNGEKVASSVVRFRWSWQRQAWQAVRNIQAGEDYNPADFRQTTIDAIKGSSFLADLPEPEGRTVARRLSTGQIVAEADFGLKKIVQRGEPVTVNYVQHSLKVTIKAVAMQDGVKGQVISVQNPSSKKALFAKVVDVDTLEIVQ